MKCIESSQTQYMQKRSSIKLFYIILYLSFNKFWWSSSFVLLLWNKARKSKSNTGLHWITLFRPMFWIIENFCTIGLTLQIQLKYEHCSKCEILLGLDVFINDNIFQYNHAIPFVIWKTLSRCLITGAFMRVLQNLHVNVLHYQ